MYSIGWSKQSPFVSAKELCHSSNLTSTFYFEIVKSGGDDQDWQSARNIIEEFYEFCKESNKQFSIIMDASKLVDVDATNAIKWVALFLKHRDTSDQLLVCSCLVTTSERAKRAICYFLLLYSPVRPFSVLSDKKMARDFIESHDSEFATV